MHMGLSIMLLALAVVELAAIATPAYAANIQIGYPNGGNLGDTWLNTNTPGTVYGGEAEVFLGNESAVRNRSTLIKFSINDTLIPKYSSIKSAILYLHLHNCFVQNNWTANYTFYGLRNGTWNESDMTLTIFNYSTNIAAANTTIVTTNNSYLCWIPVESGINDWLSADMTKWVAWEKNQSQNDVTFYINNSYNSYNQTYADFNSKENSFSNNYDPQLNVTWEPYIDSNNETKITETKNTFYSINIYDVNNLAEVQLFVNGTSMAVSETTNGGFHNFSYVGIVPNLQGEINETTINFWWNITLNGDNSTYQSINGTQSLSRLRILPCAAPMFNQSINFTIFDADLPSNQVQATMSSFLTVWIDSGSRNYTYSQSGQYNYSYCIFPGYVSSFNLNATLTVSNTSYTTNTLAVQSLPLTNTSVNYPIYLLSTTNSTLVTFTVYSNTKVPQPNILIEAMRFYPDTGLYITVAQGTTGFDGTVALPLELYKFYKYRLSAGGRVINTVSASELTSTTQSLYIQGNYVVLFNYLNLYTASCTPNNVTYHLVCVNQDYSGLLTSSKLVVKKMFPNNYSQTVCSLNGTASANSFDCDLHLYNQSQLVYEFSGVFNTVPPTNHIFTVGTLWGTNTPLLALGLMGVFLAFCLIITLFFAGMMNSPSTAIILAVLGLVISQTIGLLNIGWVAIGPIVIVAVVIVYKMEE